MNKDELIVMQQLKIEELLKNEELYKSSIYNSIMLMVGIGGPLNDNILGFTRKQRAVFHKIKDYLEEVQ